MRKLLLVALIVVGAVFAGKKTVDGVTRRMSREEAERRVRLVLGGLKESATGPQYQTAVCMWKAGTFALEQDEFRQSADEFDAWARERGLPHLRTFEIDGSVLEREAHALDPAVVIVRGTVDGRSFTAQAVARTPLVWE